MSFNKRSIKMETIQIIGYQTSSGEYKKMPLYLMSVAAGTPTPADQTIEREIDLNEFLVQHPAATFFARVNGDKLKDFGINDGDILIVDTVIEPTDGKFVLASISGELTIKIFRKFGDVAYLQSAENQYLPLKIDGYIEFILLGVVTKIIHSL